MFLIYNLVLTLLSPIWVPWMLWRTWRRKEKPNWQERTGNMPLVGKGAPPRIWIHAVSVGEVIAATPILKHLRNLLPQYQIVLSVTTSSGHQTARQLEPCPYDTLVYFPIDVARFQLSAMQQVRPKAVVIMETELWMNFLWAAKVFDAKTILVNGRISDRSFPLSMRFRFFYRSLLKFLDSALMQSEVDKERILALGARRAEVMGSSKFDQAVEGLDADPNELRNKLGIPQSAFVLVVGSTRGEPEEQLVLEAVRQVWDLGLWVLHAPRHLESVNGLLATARESLGGATLVSSGQASRYQIVDSYGMLSELYSIADVAVIGGGFQNLGGQNLIQPLAQGKPVLHGPHMQNFRDPAALADRNGAALCCRTSSELAEAIRTLMANPQRLELMSRSAKDLVRENVGASLRYAEFIAASLAPNPA